jgi:hypothetical protein
MERALPSKASTYSTDLQMEAAAERADEAGKRRIASGRGACSLSAVFGGRG